MAKGDLAKTGKLVVTVAAVAVDPSGLTAAGAGLDAYLHANEKLSNRHPDLDKLARETQGAFEAALKTRAYDKPDGARQLLPQMLQAALPGQTDFVEHGLDPGPILDDMAARLSDPEHTRPEMIAAFRALYGPLLEQVCNDPRLKAALGPAFTRARIQGEARREGKLDALGERLGNIEAQSRDTLEAIALRFGDPEPETRSLPDLKAFLIEKSKDLKALEKEIVGLKGRSARVDNIRGAAEAALAALEFEEAERLLAEAREIQGEVLREPLETNAALMEAQARAALVRGDTAEAFSLLSDAADSFLAIEWQQVVDRKHGYMQELYFHGLRYGGDGMALAEDMIRSAIAKAEAKEEEPRKQWAMCQNALAIALQQQGIRTAGPDGTALLAQAVVAFRAAISVNEVRGDRAWWADNQNNLGNALQQQGIRNAGPEGADLLGEAVAAYRDALTVRTREDHPVDWATTQNNLGAALQDQGIRTAGQAGADLLGEAVAAYRDALTVRTREDHPVDWAMTQNNLGTALQDQGIRTAGPEGADLLGEAVAAYRDALTVRTREDHPVDWAMTQNNLGAALQDQGIRTAGQAGADLLGEAVAAYRDALTVRTREDHPVDWATTQNNLGIALQQQGIRTAGQAGADLLGEAVAATRDALTVYTREDHPVQWATTQNNLGNALQQQGIRTAGQAGADLLGDAVAATRDALTVYTRKDHPVQWALTQENIAIAEAALADHDSTADPRPHLQAALDHVEAALEVFDPEHMSYNHDKAAELRDRLRARLDA